MSVVLNCDQVKVPISESLNKKKRSLEDSTDEEVPFAFLLEKQGSSHRKRIYLGGCSAALCVNESREKWLADIQNYAVIEEKKKEEKKISCLFSEKLKV